MGRGKLALYHNLISLAALFAPPLLFHVYLSVTMPCTPKFLAYTPHSDICLWVGQTAFNLVLNLTGFIPSQPPIYSNVSITSSGRNQGPPHTLLLQNLPPAGPAAYPVYSQMQLLRAPAMRKQEQYPCPPSYEYMVLINCS